ncbi:hypothetical protein QC761_0096890 [Podospora bellae-mahoneyi]|uniref:Uncharacterized protein n=1 Tax=Podospora bellae-mahoneyi TaxID=2093777 RepID=A0ABR0FCU2_9PEZI|nr:hypothetical protein QC761_0096890 [Podospora bellae-mahoneyi]
MLFVNDLPWVVHLYLEGYYLNDWGHFADNIHVVSPLMRSNKPTGSVLKDDGTPMTDKEKFLQERATAFFGKIGGRVVDEAKVGGDKSTDGTVFSRNGTAEDKEVYTLSLDKDKVMKGVTVKIEAI